jgi:hypothetical protein
VILVNTKVCALIILGCSPAVEGTEKIKYIINNEDNSPIFVR